MKSPLGTPTIKVNTINKPGGKNAQSLLLFDDYISIKHIENLTIATSQPEIITIIPTKKYCAQDLSTTNMCLRQPYNVSYYLYRKLSTICEYNIGTIDFAINKHLINSEVQYERRGRVMWAWSAEGHLSISHRPSDIKRWCNFVQFLLNCIRSHP